MSDTRTPQEWSEGLGRSIDSLAMRILMEDDERSSKDAALCGGGPAAVAEILTTIRQQAEAAGCEQTAAAAGSLLGALTEAAGQPDFGAWLSEGVLHLQANLEAESNGEPAGSPVQTGALTPDGPITAHASLAQDPDLIADFVLEAAEHLSSVEAHMLAIEQDPANLEPLHSAFRGFHTIKGLAGFLELGEIQDVAHEIEAVLDRARTGQLAISPEVVDIVLAGADHLRLALDDVDKALRGEQSGAAGDHRPLIRRIRGLLGAEPDTPPPPEGDRSTEPVGEPHAGPFAPDMEDPGRTEPENSRPTSRAAAESATVSGSAGTSPASRAVASAVKVDTAKLDHLVDMVGEMVIAQSLLRHDPDLAALRVPRIQRTLSQLSRITTDVRRTAMSMRMVPIDSLFRRISRLVRDLSRKAGKHVDLILSGEETELDRNIVEELADPLMHMVRNALDHGLEPPEERKAAGKSPLGRLALSAHHQSGLIVIELADDGRGLDRDRIVAKARQKGLVDGAESLGDNEVFNLIFEPGFSTAEIVTEVSGRGVGMDVVKRNIAKLRGRVDIRSAKGKGATFVIKLPLTLAIIDALVVGVGKERYILPVSAVHEMLRPEGDAVFTVENRAEVVMVRGNLLPMVRLHRRFRIAPRSEDPAQSLLIVSESMGKRFCLMVDELIGKQEVVIKSLGETLKNIRGIAGGAILGDGHVGLILDVDGVFGAAVDA
ncbi:MAG: chemotaxis protein CheA [Bryobacteraceae bacterium]|nr:chemotaxis protein CheA [Bryobacteraceae bacterium]